MLADLHRREMEPERLRLPDQVLELAVGQARCAAGRERCLQTREVAQELVRAVVGARTGLARREQPLGDQHQRSTVRRVRQLPFELHRARWKGDGIARERRAHRSRRRHLPIAHRQRPCDPPRGRLVPAQDVIGLDRHRLARHVGGDLRVPVAVSADPRSPPDLGRSRPVRAPTQRGQQREDRPVEQRHRGAHLVERGRRIGPHGVGQEQPLDLLLEPARQLVARRVHQVADPPQMLEHRSPLRLRGVGGQDLRHLDVAADPGRRRPPAELAHALSLLGDVHELEVGGERPRHLLRARRRQLLHDPLASAPARLARVLAQRDAREPQLLHVLEQLAAAVAPDRVAEQRRQHADVAPQRVRSLPLPAASCDGRVGSHDVSPRTPRG